MADRQPTGRQRLATLLEAAGVDYATADAAITATLADQIVLSAHVLELANPDRSSDFSDGVDWAVDTLRSAAAGIDTAARTQER